MIIRQHRHQRGFTLVEVVTAITLTTILIAIAVSAINALIKLEQSGRRRMVEASTSDGLARAFRADVRAAVQLDPPESKSGMISKLSLIRPDSLTVVYEVATDEVKRFERRDGKDIRKMNFRIPKRAKVGFEISRDQGLDVVSLVYDRESALNAETHSTAFRADAVLGRDHRFERARESK